MNFLKVIISVFTIFCISASPSYGKRKAEHVFLIGLDGWGSYSVEKADMPNVRRLMDSGAYTLKKRSVLPSESAVNWASMFMGAGPELHGYTSWNSQVPELPSRVIGDNGIFPTIFQLLRNNDSKAEIGCIYEWDGIKHVIDSVSVNYYALTPDYIKHPEKMAEMASEYIKSTKPTFAAFIFDNPDHVGHAAGHDTPEYYECLTNLDGYIGTIIDAINEAGIYDSSIIIVTADHGGIGTRHGGKSMAEMETPFIICGKNVKNLGEFNDSMMQFDIASTIAYIFGLKQPQVWIGRPMQHLFK